jgi:DNA-binding MarR family transcriptional regulator
MSNKEIEETFREFIRTLLPKWVDLKNQEVSFSQFVLLQILRKKGPKKVSELAEEMFVTLSAITGLSDKLVKNELILRERSQKDRRIVQLVITEKGEQLALKIEQQQKEKMDHIHDGFTEEELKVMKKMYEKLTHNLKNL